MASKLELVEESFKPQSPTIAVGQTQAPITAVKDPTSFDPSLQNTRDDEISELWMAKWVSMWEEEVQDKIPDEKVNEFHLKSSSSSDSNSNIEGQLNTCPTNSASSETIGHLTDQVSLICLPEDHRPSSPSKEDLDVGDCLKVAHESGSSERNIQPLGICIMKSQNWVDELETSGPEKNVDLMVSDDSSEDSNLDTVPGHLVASMEDYHSYLEIASSVSDETLHVIECSDSSASSDSGDSGKFYCTHIFDPAVKKNPDDQITEWWLSKWVSMWDEEVQDHIPDIKVEDLCITSGRKECSKVRFVF